MIRALVWELTPFLACVGVITGAFLYTPLGIPAAVVVGLLYGLHRKILKMQYYVFEEVREAFFWRDRHRLLLTGLKLAGAAVLIGGLYTNHKQDDRYLVIRQRLRNRVSGLGRAAIGRIGLDTRIRQIEQDFRTLARREVGKASKQTTGISQRINTDAKALLKEQQRRLDMIKNSSKAVRLVARVDYRPADEISGIVKSRQYRDVYWVHNDSGDKAMLYALTGEGKPVFPAARKELLLWPGHDVQQARNVDWEDIALADGKLYIADMGNNANRRQNLGIYVAREPDPRTEESARAHTFWPVRYPDQRRFPAERWEFDCEAMFIDRGKPYVLTKHRVTGKLEKFTRGTKLYRMDTAHTDRPNVLTLVDRSPSLLAPTGADLSPDGKRLAVLTAVAVYVYERPASGDRWLSEGKATFLILPFGRTKQVEAICWVDDQTLRITNEQRDIFEIKTSALVPVFDIR